MKKPVTGSQFMRWGRCLNVLLVVALLLPFMATESKPEIAPRAQPILLQMAAERPDATLSVIVQKTAQDASVEELIAQLGGAVTQDLRIINAFAAELSAKSALELAKADGVRWVSLDAPVRQSGTDDTNVSTTYATNLGAQTTTTFLAAAGLIDSPLGPNGMYSWGSAAKGSFVGFAPEVTAGHAIQKVQVVLRAYVPTKLSSTENPKLTVYVAGKAVKTFTVSYSAFNSFLGADKAGDIYVDITSSRAWKWSDFDYVLNTELVLDQSGFRHTVYYDAIGLRVTSAPGTDTSGGAAPSSLPSIDIDKNQLLNVYNQVVRATDVWSEAPARLQGQGVTVAVVDSGILGTKDLDKRKIVNINFKKGYHNSSDLYGHGTFVASLIGGDGKNSDGKVVGIAPRTNILNVRVSDDQGVATEADVVSALQWINENKSRFNIRVVNLSLNSTMAQSYHTSPLDAALEVLWFNGIVSVVSAGNNGAASLYPPANDPFVITVGATDDKGTYGPRWPL